MRAFKLTADRESEVVTCPTHTDSTSFGKEIDGRAPERRASLSTGKRRCRSIERERQTRALTSCFVATRRPFQRTRNSYRWPRSPCLHSSLLPRWSSTTKKSSASQIGSLIDPLAASVSTDPSSVCPPLHETNNIVTHVDTDLVMLPVHTAGLVGPVTLLVHPLHVPGIPGPLVACSTACASLAARCPAGFSSTACWSAWSSGQTARVRDQSHIDLDPKDERNILEKVKAQDDGTD